MPALYLFQRRTLLGGDDLQPAAFLTIGLRCFQLLLLMVPVMHRISRDLHTAGGFLSYLLYDPSMDEDCRHSHYFPLLFVIYALSSSVYSLASMSLEWKIASWSSRGSPTDREPRSSHVARLVEYKLVPFSLVLFVIWMIGLGACLWARRYYQCLRQDENTLDSESLSHKILWIAFLQLLASQLGELLFSWSFLLHLCTQPTQVVSGTGSDFDDLEIALPNVNHELVEQMWADRCSSFCQCLSVASCFVFGGRELAGQAEFGDVARALADYLETGGVLDVVPSDIATGLVILQILQKQRLEQSRLAVLEQVPRTDRLGTVVDTPVPSGGEDVRHRLLDAPVSECLAIDERSLASPNYDTTSLSSHRDVLAEEVHRQNFAQNQNALLDPRNSEDVHLLNEGARYANYALAIYTWVLYLYVHPCTGIPRLVSHSIASCYCCRRSSSQRQDTSEPGSLHDPSLQDSGRVVGDNLCSVHKKTLLMTAGLQDSDLVYAQLRSGFADNPYCILLDHEWKSVVVSIRGTFSLEDCVTDVLIEPEALDSLGEEYGFDGGNQYCHGGVLACTRNVFRDLQRHRLLEQLLLGDNALYPDYTLRLVGHSLGAATCTLLSFMLRKTYPNVRCLNYCPPGCTLTWELATACQGWCVSFVLDSDLVPRLTIDTMNRLRDEILELIGRIKIPKIDVVRKTVGGFGVGFLRGMFTSQVRDWSTLHNIHDVLYDPSEVPDSLYQQQLSRFREIQQARREARGAARLTKMFPPGKMIHLSKIGEKHSCLYGSVRCLTCGTTSFGSEYIPVWIKNNDLDEIVVSPTMGTDHFPNRIRCVLTSIASSYDICP